MDNRFEVTEEEIENLQDQGFTEEELEWLKSNKDTLSSGILDAHIDVHFTNIYNVAETMLSQERQGKLRVEKRIMPSKNFHGIPLPQANYTERDTGVMRPIYEKE